jgi:hypothetical protein
MKKPIIFFFLFVLFSVTPVLANEISIETSGATHFLMLKTDSPVNISGYFLQLNVSGDTAIQSLQMLPPFEGAVNIRNDLGFAKIAAFTAAPSSSNRLAEISYTGSGDIRIIVFELTDEHLRQIPVSNAEVVTDIPAPVDSLPIYNPPPQYRSSGISPLNPGSYSPVTNFPINPGLSTPTVTAQPRSSLTRQLPDQPVPQGTKDNEPIINVPAGEPADTTRGIVPADQLTSSGSPTQKAGLPMVWAVAALGILFVSVRVQKKG